MTPLLPKKLKRVKNSSQIKRVKRWDLRKIFKFAEKSVREGIFG
jgi:hypothetical protein